MLERSGSAGRRRIVVAMSGRVDSATAAALLKTQGHVLGQHRGIAFYTVGQRKGLGVAAGEPLYVLSVDRAARTVVVGRRDELQKNRISVKSVNWIAFEEPPGRLELSVRIRYQQQVSRATVWPQGDDRASLSLFTPQTAAAPGQSAVFYDGNVVVGGGIIDE